ncbi:MAG TPA: hypothetical protein VHH88_07230, partial [Verrucomicrobiae bacterium]|nr:hypothetical protein [Verrucomicrobiae bacterium]
MVSTHTNSPRGAASSSRRGASPTDFLRAGLPWVLAACAFVFYLATLNHWISFSNLAEVARTSGWLWQPELSGPLTWLVTLPFRLLPEAIRPAGLNLFSALCAALSLGLLARSVLLWPHDRTLEQRQKEHGPFWLLSIPSAWMPAVFAVLLCGLQLTFWEHATSISSPQAPWGSGCEMLDLLLFAYVICSLLEFRLDQKESRLTRAALIYGLGITNNWAMIAYFPLFLAALIWIRGLAFFRTRFLVRMFLWGLAGLSLYLLLPLVQSFAHFSHVPFWTGLHHICAAQKTVIVTLIQLLKSNPQLPMLLAVTSLIPLLVISIRWASYFGDSSPLGVALTTFAFHVVHAALLLVCIWVALDPSFYSRILPFLSLSYLGALSAGYFIGYFLLIF